MLTCLMLVNQYFHKYTIKNIIDTLNTSIIEEFTCEQVGKR